MRAPEALLRQFALKFLSRTVVCDPLSALLSSPFVQQEYAEGFTFGSDVFLARAIRLAGPMALRGFIASSTGFVDATPYMIPPLLLVLTKGLALDLIPFVAEVSEALGKEMKGQAVQAELASVIQRDPHIIKQLWGPNGACVSCRILGSQHPDTLPCPPAAAHVFREVSFCRFVSEASLCSPFLILKS